MTWPFTKANISHGSASWLTLGRACRYGLFHDGPDRYLIGDWKRFVALPVYKKIESNIFTLGPPRSGKGAGSVVPNALRWKRLAIYEPNGEGAAVALKHLRDDGYYVGCVNPGHLHAEAPYLAPAHSFNVVAMLDPDRPDFGSLCHWLGGLLVERTGNEHDPFFVNKPEGVSATLIMFIRLANAPEDQHLGTLRKHVMADNKGWERLVQRMKDWCADPHNEKRYSHLVPVILNRANEISRTLSVKDNRTWDSVLSSLESFTRWLDIPDVAECVKGNDIDFERFKTADKAALLFMVDGNFARSHSGFGRMFVAAVVMAMRRKPLAKSRALLILDEFDTLHYPGIESELATCPKYRLSIQVVVQTIAQLKNVAKIEGACEVRQYMAANDYETADHISKLCGVSTVVTETVSGGRATTHFTHRQLVTLDEVLTLHKEQQIVLIDNARPALLRLRPYWERPLLRGTYYPNPFFKGINKGLKPWWPFEVIAGAGFRIASWFLGPSKTMAALWACLALGILCQAGIKVDDTIYNGQHWCAYRTLTGLEWRQNRGDCGLVKFGDQFFD